MGRNKKGMAPKKWTNNKHEAAVGDGGISVSLGPGVTDSQQVHSKSSLRDISTNSTAEKVFFTTGCGCGEDRNGASDRVN